MSLSGLFQSTTKLTKVTLQQEGPGFKPSWGQFARCPCVYKGSLHLLPTGMSKMAAENLKAEV